MPGKKEKKPLSVTHPELAKEADGWDPATVTPGSQKKLPWKCSKGHKWLAIVNNRSRQSQNCTICSGKKVLSGFNDLASKNPELAKQAFGWNPREFTEFSNKRLMWKCNKGHTWEAQIDSRSRNGLKCPICMGKKILSGFNDLATLNPELAVQASGWDPSEVALHSNKNLTWKCKFGHIWKTTVSNRSNGDGCPICSGQKILTGFNDLGTLRPELALEADGWDCSIVAQWSHKSAKWKCSLGHKYEAVIADRSSGTGCSICAGKKILVGFNDLQTTNPRVAAQAYKWDPKKVTEFSNKILMWECEVGHKWRASVSHRSNDRGCPSCANSGYDPNLDGFLYFLKHSSWMMLQVGITNFPDNRLSKHSKSGWELLELRGPMDGHLTQQWETAILRMLKAKGADLSNSKIAGKFDGYSEAWSKSTFEAKTIKELMKLTEEFEEKK
jgi:hypothetical protein